MSSKKSTAKVARAQPKPQTTAGKRGGAKNPQGGSSYVLENKTVAVKNSPKQKRSAKKEQRAVKNSAEASRKQRSKELRADNNQTAVQAQQGAGYTEQEVQQIVDEIVATPKPKRIWEVDFLRGLMILFVVWDHLMWDIVCFEPYNSDFFNKVFEFAKMYEKSVLRDVAQPVFVTMFVFTSGVSCSFSRSNGKRAIKMVAFSLLFTAVTYAVSAIIQQDVTIYFNVIHAIALSVVLWTVVEWAWSKCDKAWKKNVFGVVMTAVVLTSLVVGGCALAPKGGWTDDNPMWYFLAKHARDSSGHYTEGYEKFLGADYLPFLPDFGWFLVGAFLGKFLYKKRETLFPSVNEKFVSPITFCGRHSIWVYFGSQVLMYGILYLIAGVWGWL